MGKTLFEDGNLLNRVPGTRVMAAWLNKVFSHRHDGRDQDGSSILDYGVDTGPVNALVVAMTPPFEVQTVGLPFTVKVAHTNTEGVTLALDGFPIAPIHKLGGLPLGAGDLQGGQIIQLAWDGTLYQLLSFNSPPVTDAETLQGQTAGMLAPPGVKGEFFMPTAPPGWLPCDGRAILREQYPALFAAIGTTWGAGDNVSTFNLPEVRGDFFRAWDNGRGVDADRQFGSWQGDEFRTHNHINGAYKNLLKDPYGGSLTGNDNNGSGAELPVGAGDAGSIVAAGGSETRPRNIAVLVCIKY